tara:strand:- start:3886 stop:5526 length:1641 start_codon:yes stop_codon:yes gene_type:complete
MSSSGLKFWYRDSVPCRGACPADTDIPGYLEAIYNNDFNLAYDINFNDNFFPEILGRVCSRPCEKLCRHGENDNGESVSICFSKRSAGKYSSKHNPKLQNKLGLTNKKILIIGGGVAGLAASAELIRFGHDVTLYEKHSSLGGMLNQGIPIFRLPRDIIEKEIKQITRLGLKVKLNKSIESKQEIEELAKKFDAVVCAMGTLKPNYLNQEFENSTNVENGLDFLLRVNEYNDKYVGKNVIVIGGGYTSMDCARTAIRLGAKTVKTFYRRQQGDLEILPGELEELVHERGKMIFRARPKRIIEKEGRLKYLELNKTNVDKNNKLKDIPNSNFKIKTDHIILAIGQKQSFLNNYHSKNIFYAGDYKLGATTLITAIGDAKKVAKDIDKFLMKRNIHKEKYSIQRKESTKRSLNLNYVPLTEMKLRNLENRTFKAEVELGYNKLESKKESSRCYLCHYQYDIDNNLCVLCDECLLVKPVSGCIKELSSKSIDSEGEVIMRDIKPGESHGIYHGLLYIDPKVCVRCGECEKACPTGAIKLSKVSKLNAPA